MAPLGARFPQLLGGWARGRLLAPHRPVAHGFCRARKGLRDIRPPTLACGSWRNQVTEWQSLTVEMSQNLGLEYLPPRKR